MSLIRFKFASQKALVAIHWMVQQEPRIDLHSILKAVYFADKAHLNKYGRPIFGARYRAMKFGPVPIEVYEMAKGEPLWLAELCLERFPWRLENYRLVLDLNDAPDLSVLSETDIEELSLALKLSCGMSFDARTAATHGLDWQKANLGYMDYGDMIDEAPDKADRVSYLRESASYPQTLRVTATLDVVWYYDGTLYRPKWKMAVCVCAEQGFFFRINTRAWPIAVPIGLPDHHFLDHDSFIECSGPIELDDFLIEEGFKEFGSVGVIDKSVVPAIIKAVEVSRVISHADKQAICLALTAVCSARN